MTQTDFVKYFISEHLVGAIQIVIKKLHAGKDQVPVDFNFMPADHLYAIYNKNMQNSKSIHVDEYDMDEEAIERKRLE